jgi:pimeloyl-ACP methyl ester carboxylesterase
MKKEYIEVENGEKVDVVHAEADSDKWFFVCHGFGGHKDRQLKYLELAEEGFNVVGFSFRGNGDSDGEFIEQNLSSRIEDLKAVVEHFEPEETILFGTSFGAKVALHSADKLDADAVVVKSPVTYNEIMDKFREAVENKGKFEFIDGKPIDERFFEDFDSYSFDDLVDEINVPVAIFHGADDKTVHPKYSFEAAEKLETSFMLEKMRGEDHSFSEKGKDYMLSQIVTWLRNNGF